MVDRPVVVVVGPDAERIVSAWQEAERSEASERASGSEQRERHASREDPTEGRILDQSEREPSEARRHASHEAERSEGPNRASGSDRPFELVDADPDAVATILEERLVDAVVCHAGGSTIAAVAERAHAADQRLPVVAFATGDGLDPAAVVDLDVDQYVDVDGEFDPVAAIAGLEPLIDRHRCDRRERTMLDSLLENIPLSVYFKDRRSRHVRVSDEMLDLIDHPYIENPEGKFHHAPEDVHGKTDFDLYNADLAESAVADDRRVVETEEPVEGQIEHAYGSPTQGAYVATSKAPWYDEDGRVVGLVGVSRDVSERKRYERRLERQNERLERFARVISHDLRNPLGVALGRIDFARETGDPEHFDAIERSLERMDSLIEDVLTLARHGEAVSDPEPTELQTLASEAWDVIDADEAALSVPAEGCVLADAGRLRQLLENLFRNAVEHGGPDVAVTVDRLEDGRGFYVADDGPGIPEDEREHVFESGYSTDDEGTGLGLSIVRTVAEAHNWDVAVTESDAGGARFEFACVLGSDSDRGLEGRMQ
ncbi:sensor histidine kinase [Halomicrobium salinisoli]|uniref:sensor histidine kinase n=1 Tax=Halomicrobium salinisoli TaxID=2878391 RepID=UPI001CEFDBDC|nr:PAS domain-containing sensor histidine kinase [Halomicrobium salinisoli]